MLVPDHQTLIIEAHERRAKAQADRQRTLARHERKAAPATRVTVDSRPRRRTAALGLLATVLRLVVTRRPTAVAATARRSSGLPFAAGNDSAAVTEAAG